MRWLRRLLLVMLLILAGALLLAARFVQSQNQAMRSTGPPVKTYSPEQDALAATVQIILVAPRVDTRQQPMYVSRNGERFFQLVYDEGLGTAVRAGHRNLIITHDHWCELTTRLLYVEIRDCNGVTLAYLQPAVFRNSIVYRDGGTMAFLAPETVPVQRSLGEAHTLQPGDPALIVAHADAGGALRVFPAQITTSESAENPASFRVRMEGGGMLTHGDSGAGVWHAGALVGNLWAVVDEQVLPANPETRYCTPRPTAVGVVAGLPEMRRLRP